MLRKVKGLLANLTNAVNQETVGLYIDRRKFYGNKFKLTYMCRVTEISLKTYERSLAIFMPHLKSDLMSSENLPVKLFL